MNSGGNNSDRSARVIAFYLPQFHPIPENDAWWGKGFTEWTNVAKAKPMFRGHYQPRIPADLGFYDLRVPESRFAQAELAAAYGVEAFCYWHYWFAGRRLLERPFEEVLRTKEPRFKFCLAWANQTWSGIWHGEPHRTLIEQTYAGPTDYERHFRWLLEAFEDDRYLTVNGKPLFVVFKPKDVPDLKRMSDVWRELAQKAGLRGLYLVGDANLFWNPRRARFRRLGQHGQPAADHVGASARRPQATQVGIQEVAQIADDLSVPRCPSKLRESGAPNHRQSSVRASWMGQHATFW